MVGYISPWTQLILQEPDAMPKHSIDAELYADGQFAAFAPGQQFSTNIPL